MKNPKHIVAAWSGGIDSTAVLAQLAQRGYHIRAVALTIYQHLEAFNEREKIARAHLTAPLNRIALDHGGSFETVEKPASWIWAFSADGVEIPRRNKHILDHLIMTEMIPRDIFNIGLGEYSGADTRLIQHLVPAADVDHRALTAYVYLEYGLDYRLISAQDFGESRYKSDRLKLGIDVLGDAMLLTTVCGDNSLEHCGSCYKCVERVAAFTALGITDTTTYTDEPRSNERFALYMKQMKNG